MMKRKLLSILLSLAIVCPIVGIPAFAENDDTAAEHKAEEAINTSSDGQIALMTDENTITVAGSIIGEFNDRRGVYVYTITADDGQQTEVFSSEDYCDYQYCKAVINQNGKIIDIFNLGDYAGKDIALYRASGNDRVENYIRLYTPDGFMNFAPEKDNWSSWETYNSIGITDDYVGAVAYWYDWHNILNIAAIEPVDTFTNVMYKDGGFAETKQPCTPDTQYISYYGLQLVEGEYYTIDVLNYGTDGNTSYIAVYPATTNINENITYTLYGMDETVHLKGTGELTADDAEAFNKIPSAAAYLDVGEGITGIKDIILDYSRIDIPSTVTALENIFYTSYNSNASQNIYVDEDNPKFSSENGTLFDKEKKELIHYGSASGVSFQEPIRPGSYTTTYREQYTVPQTVERIGDYAFAGAYLDYAYLPDGLTYLGTGAFKDARLIRISIPEGVERIEDETFSECPLTGIELPEGTKSIGSNAFYGCYALKNVYIPLTLIQDEPQYDETGAEIEVPNTNLTSIGDRAFYGCTSLTGITLPDSVANIGESAFDGCESLSEIKLPESLTSISYGAFCGCLTLESVSIPEKVQSIGESAFERCTALAGVEMQNGVTSIGKRAFYGCEKLESIKISDNITEIGISAFENCAVLDEVTLPSKLKTIGDSAFLGCSGITEIIIPNGVTTIGDRAFGDTSITRMTLPDTVTSIGYSILYGCELESFNTGDGIENMGGALGDAELKHLKIGAKVTYPGSFSAALESVELNPDNHNLRLDNGALYDINTTILYFVPRDAAEFTIPDTVKEIEYSAFSGCDSMSTLNTGDGIEELDIYNGLTSLKKLVFGANVRNTSYTANFIRGSAELSEIDVSEDNPNFTTDGAALFNKQKTTLCFVPRNLSEYEIPEGVTEIAYGAFAHCNSIESIVIPDGVEKISGMAFEECLNLKSATIAATVSTIVSSAFYGCENLVIKCLADTEAYRYAEELGIPYEVSEDTRNMIILEIYGADGKKLTTEDSRDEFNNLVHSDVSIKWYRISDGRFEYLGDSATLRNVDADAEYMYALTLNGEIRFKYVEPEPVTLKFQSDNNVCRITHTLQQKPYELYEIPGGYIRFDSETGTAVDLYTDYEWVSVPRTVNGVTVERVTAELIYNRGCSGYGYSGMRIPETVKEIVNIDDIYIYEDESEFYDDFKSDFLTPQIKENSPMQALLEAHGITEEYYEIVTTEPGDVNDDGFVNSDDAVYISDHLKDPEKYPLAVSGDLDGNGTVDIKDAVYIVKNTPSENDRWGDWEEFNWRTVYPGGKISVPLSLSNYHTGDYIDVKSMVIYDITGNNGITFDDARAASNAVAFSDYDGDSGELVIVFRKNTKAKDIAKLRFTVDGSTEDFPEFGYKAYFTQFNERGYENRFEADDGFDDWTIEIIEPSSEPENKISFADRDGYEIAHCAESAGEDINISVDLTAETIEAENAVDLYFAQYDENGALLKVDKESSVAGSGTYAITPDDKTNSVKVFVWNENNKPVTDCSEID